MINVKLNVKFIDYLIVVAFFCSLIITAFLADFTEIKTVKSHEIYDYYGKYVRFCGNVKSKTFSERSNTLFIRLRDEFGEITCVKFRSENVVLPSEICVEGEVSMYKNKPEIIIRKVYPYPNSP